MSELQTRFIDDTYAEYYNTGKHELAQIYLKKDVDKLIADLEESHKKEVEQLLMEIVELKKERRWRSVNKELPKVEEDYGEFFLVAVAVETETRPKGSYVTSAEFCNGEWYNDANGNELEENVEREDCFYRSKVTHWMPLPSAPKDAK